MFYVDPSNTLQNLIFSASTSTWSPGKISAQNIDIYPSSTLAALYNPCITCRYTTILAYQDKQGYINIANQTNVNNAWQTRSMFGGTLGATFALQNNTDAGDIGIRANLWYQGDSQEVWYYFWHPG